jgi:hypothetical protein
VAVAKDFRSRRTKNFSVCTAILSSWCSSSISYMTCPNPSSALLDRSNQSPGLYASICEPPQYRRLNSGGSRKTERGSETLGRADFRQSANTTRQDTPMKKGEKWIPNIKEHHITSHSNCLNAMIICEFPSITAKCSHQDDRYNHRKEHGLKPERPKHCQRISSMQPEKDSS